MGCLVIILFVLGVAAAGAIYGAFAGDDDSPSSEDLRYGAFDVCTDFVRDRLRAPATATFRNYFEDDGEVRVTGSGNGPYTVTSTVDAENGFGANIRSSFVCVVNLDDDTWRLADITITD